MKRTISTREEANAITCYAFRNGFIEDLHAGRHSPLLDDPELSRITDEEMEKLMKEAAASVEKLLRMKETDSDRYWELIEFYTETYTRDWD